MFRSGYILNGRQDLIWFLGLPYAAVGVALASQQWLPAIAMASIALWITTPHHFASWLRTYGLAEDRHRYKDRLLVGPAVLFCLTLAGMTWVPITTAMMVLLWDHQHSLMQQHGFARIYDFKAKTGAPQTGRYDLVLAWVLFGNMLITSPLFVPYLLREMYRLHLPVSIDTVHMVQTTSWVVFSVWLLVYTGHVIHSVVKGHPCNPVKYLFIFSSYFLWYYCSWHTSNLLVFGIAHRIMHGVQYIVMVYWYMRRKTAGESKGFAARLVRPGNIAMFIGVGIIYAAAFQLLTGGPLAAFGFGVLPMAGQYKAIPELGLQNMTYGESYALMSAVLINVFGLTHYYFDSFIWKVSDSRTQKGLS